MTVHPVPAQPHLPTWPLLGFFWSYGIGWALGLAPLLPLLWGALMVAHLALRGDVRFPRVLITWAGFLLVAGFSGLQLDTAGRAVGLGFRLTGYAAATVALLYVYNSSSSWLTDRRIALALTVLWAWVVLGGILGVLFPDEGLSTPMAALLPRSLIENDLVRDLVNPRFAEVQQPWGSPERFARPSAPFVYANGWGCNFALLTPFAVATLRLATGKGRLVMVAAVVMAAIPAAATLNRGMFVALGIGLIYSSVRMAGRARWGPLVAIAVAAVVSLGALQVSGVLDRILLRTQYSATNAGRAAIYGETWQRTLDSPLLGWGGPRPSRLLDISVGTQGHVWNVMFSHGLLGLALFLATLWWMVWRTRHTDGVAFSAHVTLLMAAVAVTYYGFDGPQIVVAFTAAGIAMRHADRGTARATTTTGRHEAGALHIPEAVPL